MDFAYDLSGTTNATIRRYQVAATASVTGKPFLVPASSGSGLVTSTTTSALKAVGVNIDTSGTYVTAQQTDSSDTARTVGIVLNPQAVYRIPMSGGATEGTAMVLHTAASGATDGLSFVSDVNTDSPELDEGTVFCIQGANQGLANKCTSNSTTTMTFVRAWPRDVAAGDLFVVAPYFPLQGITLQLTTLLTQADASIAVGTGAAFKTLEFVWNKAPGEGRTNNYVMAMLANHILAAPLADS